MRILQDSISSKDGSRDKHIVGELFKKEINVNGETIFRKVGENKILNSGAQILAAKMNLKAYPTKMRYLEDMITGANKNVLFDADSNYKLSGRTVGITDLRPVTDRKLEAVNMVYCGFGLMTDGAVGIIPNVVNSGEDTIDVSRMVRFWKKEDGAFSEEDLDDYLEVYDKYTQENSDTGVHSFLMKKIGPVIVNRTKTGTDVNDFNGTVYPELDTLIDFPVEISYNEIVSHFPSGGSVKFNGIVLFMGIPYETETGSPVPNKEVFRQVIVAHRINFGTETLTIDKADAEYKYRIVIK